MNPIEILIVLISCIGISYYLGWTNPHKKKVTEVIPVDSTSLTLDQWRRHGELISAAERLHKDKDFQLMLQVLATESPVNYPLVGLNIQATDHLIHCGKVDGWQMCLNTISAMKEPLAEDGLVEATFESPNKEVAQ